LQEDALLKQVRTMLQDTERAIAGGSFKKSKSAHLTIAWERVLFIGTPSVTATKPNTLGTAGVEKEMNHEQFISHFTVASIHSTCTRDVVSS